MEISLDRLRETGVTMAPIDIKPAIAGAMRASTISEEQFYEALAAIEPDLPNRLKAFLSDTTALGVYADVRRNLFTNG